jgi:hypothetical protein
MDCLVGAWTPHIKVQAASPRAVGWNPEIQQLKPLGNVSISCSCRPFVWFIIYGYTRPHCIYVPTRIVMYDILQVNLHAESFAQGCILVTPPRITRQCVIVVSCSWWCRDHHKKTRHHLSRIYVTWIISGYTMGHTSSCTRAFFRVAWFPTCVAMMWQEQIAPFAMQTVLARKKVNTDRCVYSWVCRYMYT